MKVKMILFKKDRRAERTLLYLSSFLPQMT